MRKKVVFSVLLLFVVAGFLFWHFSSHQPAIKNNYTADILITNAEVLTMDAHSDIYNPGWVEIKDGKIIALGEGTAPAGIRASKIINVSGKLVMPGLVNTHAHSAMTLLTGLGSGEALEPWLNTMSVLSRV